MAVTKEQAEQILKVKSRHQTMSNGRVHNALSIDMASLRTIMGITGNEFDGVMGETFIRTNQDGKVHLDVDELNRIVGPERGAGM